MEDIYGDLNNYEDVISVQELRNENKELKVKLEEYATAMEKLQKDYDILELEFKKLEHNYSSLLKTARAEIERKTERISQLNIEKDMMVLNALNSGKYIKRNFNPGVKNTSKINYEKPYKGKGNKKRKDDDDVKQKNIDVLNERHETTVLQTKDTVPDSGTYNKNKFENTNAKVELPYKGKSDVKENIAHQKTELSDTPKTRASSIKDRRKSMPAVSMPIDAFSSDDELERNYHTKDTRTDDLSKDKFEKRNSNKILLDRHSNKTSDTSSVDDRGYNYHESTLKDKGRSSRRHKKSSYRGRDKYEVSLKYRKYNSPERGQKRRHRGYQDEYYRQEQGRYQGRSLESPPPDSHSRHQRRNRDYRSDYDRYSHDHEKHRHHYEEKYTVKYGSNDYDEPHTKRQKTESYDKPDAHFRDDRRMDVQSIPEFSPHEYDILRLSCQSPDSVHTDGAFANPIKEIMATADSPLEDPRETSKRYVIKKENGKDTLSTVAGRNINIKSVNKAEWNIEPVSIPVALVRRPSQCRDEFVKDIYMGIGNPGTNLNISMESGEIREVEDGNHEIHKPKKIQHDSQHLKQGKQVTEGLSKLATSIDKVSKPSMAKYRIPKIGQNNKNTQSKIDDIIVDLDENVPHHKNVYKKGVEENSFLKELIPHKQLNKERDEFLPTSITYSKKEGKNEEQNQTRLTKIAIVADDLELSDDNSDNVDTNRRAVPESIQKNCKMKLNIKEAKKEDSVKNIENKTCSISSHNNEIEKTVDTAGIKNVSEEEKTKESDSTKKQKIKKKKSKSKEISKDLVESTADVIPVPEKKTRPKKEKEGKPKETKEKFTDLFGDSSSLMTPEDLGIPSYLPISEDTQDAVDIKINQIIEASPLIDKDEITEDKQTQNSVEIKEQETTTHDDNPKEVSQKSNTEVENKEVPKDIKKKKSPKRKEEILDPCNKLPSPIVYKNLNPGTDSNDLDVVKTVIISTGLQPEITLENNTEVAITKPTTDIEVNAKQTTTDINQIPAIIEFKRHDILKALATSTPQKEFTATNVDAGSTDDICDSEVSQAVAMTPNTEPVLNKADTNPLDSHDAPDVRIFVKRRRKVVKRPPMT